MVQLIPNRGMLLRNGFAAPLIDDLRLQTPHMCKQGAWVDSVVDMGFKHVPSLTVSRTALTILLGRTGDMLESNSLFIFVFTHVE